MLDNIPNDVLYTVSAIIGLIFCSAFFSSSETALTGVQREIGFAEIVHDDGVGKVSLIGAGMRNHPGVTATFCEALSQAGINIETMNTSEIRISVICRVDQLDTAVGALHSAFELGGGERAVVHAGTGR